MTFAEVTPVAVGYPRRADSVETVPAERHLLHWLVLRPALEQEASAGVDRTESGHRARRQRSLLESVDATLTVDGEEVGIVVDVVGADDDRAAGYWNITDPLPVGTHTTTLTLAFDQSNESEVDARYVAASDGSVVQWPEGGSLSMATTLSVVPEDRTACREGTDPLWSRRTVAYPANDPTNANSDT